jgi:hypothetical protein
MGWFRGKRDKEREKLCVELGEGRVCCSVRSVDRANQKSSNVSVYGG